MKSHGLTCAAEDVPNLRGDDARVQFIKCFKEVQRLKTQLDQYTDLTAEDKVTIDQILPKDELNAFRGVYLETAQRLKTRQSDWGMLREESAEYDVNQLDFEFVLFASAVIEMTRDELIGLIQSDAKFMDEREVITDYVRSLKEGEGLGETAIRDGYQSFKAERNAAELAVIAERHGLSADTLQAFADTILQRMIFDGEQLTDLMQPLELNWKERRLKELALMEDLVPLLTKRAQGRTISGLSAYEQ
jgi:type I restriction enzyme R subunit